MGGSFGVLASYSGRSLYTFRFAMKDVSRCFPLCLRVLLSLVFATVATASDDSPERATSEILFLDAGVKKPEILLSGIRENVEVVSLDRDRDGVSQIAAALNGRLDLAAIHIVSHGEVGKLHLGSATLTESRLIEYSTDLSIIRGALSPEGDVLFYGCDLASGSVGESFVHSFAQRVAVDVAASSNATGSPLLGGDWDLETRIGQVEADLAFNDTARAAYDVETLGFTQGQFLTGSANTNNYGSLAIGPGGTVYGAWQYAVFPDTGNIRFATWNGAGWTEIPGSALTGTIVASQLTGLDLVNQLGTDAMKIDSNGDIHVALHISETAGGSGSQRGVGYGFFDTSTQTWAFRRIYIFQLSNGFRNPGNGEAVMLLDGSENPHIVFGWSDATDPDNYDIVHAFDNGSGWNVTGTTNALDGTTVDTVTGGAEISGIDAAFDSAGNIHVSYVREDADQISGDVWYVKRTGTSWGTPAEVADTNDVYITSIAIDSNDKVHIAYAQETIADQESTFKITSDVSGSFATISAGSVTAPANTDFFQRMFSVNISINASDQRVLSGSWGAYDVDFNRLAEAVVVSSETAPGTFVVEDGLVGSASSGSFYINHAMILEDDNTVTILQGGRDDDFTTGNLQYANGVPDALSVTPEMPAAGAALSVNVSGSQATFDIYLENLGDVELDTLSLPLNLAAALGSGNYSVTSAPSFIDDPGTITLNAGFNGSGTTQLLSSGTLAAGDTAQIRLVVTVNNVQDLGSGLGVYSSQVTFSGVSPESTTVSDLSDNGTDPDPNGNGDANEAGENDATMFTVVADPVIGVAKDASVSGQTVTIDFYLENFGNVELQSLSLVDDLDSVFGAGSYTVTSGPTLIDDPGTITLNGGFDGSGTTQLITSGTLSVNDTAQIRIVVETAELQDAGSGLGIYSNQVTASGQGPGIPPDSDLSDSGTDPDPDGDGNPDEAGENDATSITVAEQPVIGVAKDVSITGRTATIDFYLENFGNVTLSQVSLPVDLDTTFGAGNYSITSPPSLIDDPGTLTLNGSFNGGGTTDIFVPGSSTLAFADTAQIRVVVEVITVTDQGSGLGIYDCQVTAAAQSPDGTMTSDLSDSGTDPDPNGNGDPTDAGEDDASSVTLRGSIGDLVWDDMDGDGMRDAGEPGLAGVTVFLDQNQNGTLDGGEPFAATNSTGGYEFTDLAAATYYVRVDVTSLPAGFMLTSGANPQVVSLFAGEQDDTIDFAFSLPETPSLEVTTTGDVVNAFDEETSVREALEYAATLMGGQEVTFDPALFAGGAATFPIATELQITSSVTITGPGADLAIFDGGSVSNVFAVDDSTGTVQRVVLSSIAIQNGDGASRSDGGAITNVEDLILIGVEISNCTSSAAIAGIYSTGPLSIFNSLLANNSGLDYGGIFQAGTENLTIVNSTLSGNSGIGVGLADTSTMLLSNTTITANTGSSAVLLTSGVSLTINNSIVAGNNSGDIDGAATATVVSNGANFIGDPQGVAAFSSDASFASTGTVIGDVLDPTLSDNGGPTMTHALVPGSPAIDSGLDADLVDDVLDLDGDMDTLEPQPFDQRGVGFERVIMGDPASGVATVDMGAFELFAPPTFDAGLFSVASTAGPVDLLDLSGATPDDGMFFGPGVSGSIFDPSSLAPGQYVISYTITDEFGVKNVNSFTIELFRGQYRPDLRYGLRGNARRHDGDNQYGGGQSLQIETRQPRNVFFLSAENDGNVPDSLRTKARGIAKRDLNVRIIEKGGDGNVTGAILRGGHVSALRGGAFTRYKVIMKIKDRIRSRNFASRWICSSESSRSARDKNRVLIQYKSPFERPESL